MKDHIENILKNRLARYILTGASYVLLTALFFGIGYSIGTKRTESAFTAPVSAVSPAEEASPSPAPTEEALCRLILEGSSLRLYGADGTLMIGTEINEALFPRSDIELLRNGMEFKTTEEALAMMENFLS